MLELPLGSHTRAGAGSLAPDAAGVADLIARRARAAWPARTSRWSATTPAGARAAGGRAPPVADLAARPDAVRRAGGVSAGAVQADVRPGSVPAAAVGVPAAAAVHSRAATADRVRLADQARRCRAPRRAGARRPCGTARSCATARHSRGVLARRALDVAPKLRSFQGEVVMLWPPEDPLLPLRAGRAGRGPVRRRALIEVEDSYCFVPVDRPDALAAVL